jgi:hypothetical protein
MHPLYTQSLQPSPKSHPGRRALAGQLHIPNPALRPIARTISVRKPLFLLARSALSLYSFFHMKNPVKLVIVIGLALGGIFGIAGSMIAERNLQSVCWAIDGVGLIVATALLALHYFRAGRDSVAAGFLVFSIGESVMLAGTAATLEASVPSFAAGIALWSAALLLTSIPRQFAVWARVTGIVGAILFAFTAARIFGGEQILPTAKPLPFFAYPFLVLTFAGWIWAQWKTE